MKVCEFDRDFMCTMLMHSLQALELWPFAIEQGWFKGNNTQRLLENLNHELPVLVVSCSTAATHAYSPFDPQPDWIYPSEACDFNFGGPSWDRLCEEYSRSFVTQPMVHIVRASIAEALPAFRALAGGSAYDLIDVDASHQHEDMLRDLMLNQALVGPQGAFMRHECCHSEAELLHSPGVLEVLDNFLKSRNFTPIASTNTEWPAIILTQKGILTEQALHWSLVNSDIAFVDVPSQLFPAARMVRGDQKDHLPFV